MINSRILQLVLSCIVGVFCAIHVYSFYEVHLDRSDFLYWDPAAHAYYGVQIAEDIKQLDFLHLLLDTNEQVSWPPLHSFLQIPFQFFFGSSFYSSAICSFVFFALFFPAITYLFHQLDTDWAGWLVLMALTATSPYYSGYSSMPMLEIFGAVLTAFSAALYLKKSKWFPLSLALLFFLKYNYCIYILIAVAIDQGIEYVKKHPAPFHSFRIAWSPFRIFVFLYLLFLLAIFITGGFQIGKLQVRGIGNPLYFLLWIVVIRALVLGQHKKIWAQISGTGWKWFVIPVLIWLLIPIPNRVRTIVSFAINAPLGGSSPSELSYYTFYFDALSVYFANHWFALVCTIGAGAVCILFRKDRRVLFLGLLFVLPFLLMTLNQNKQERYLFTFVFVVWVLFSYGIARIKRSWVRSVAGVFVCGILLYHYDTSAVQKTVAWPFVPKEVEAPVQFIVEQTSGAKEIRILGVTNQMSPALLAYHIRKAAGFKLDPNFEWNSKKMIPDREIIVGINTPLTVPIVMERSFPGNILIQVSKPTGTRN